MENGTENGHFVAVPFPLPYSAERKTVRGFSTVRREFAKVYHHLHVSSYTDQSIDMDRVVPVTFRASEHRVPNARAATLAELTRMLSCRDCFL